ncbi:potassium channel family protein [Caproiciproducens faecalis]|uniref:Trk system potassium uptake protein TrkA n=1 Tax=Caproiciproducens faecalis TaxID=2820301 RepID=A0ABS7DKC6_9FIRM|nr:TrkA family potassium uptake protein [Caproiciproducens faecalis]MBW7571744.1 TrkA family potassium uptake protein [Caproiciproducens faecalis]
MKVIVVGLGRMGTGIALNLTKKGHQVTVIDSNPDAFKNLGKEFSGNKVTGIGFDRDVLNKARIDQVDAVVSCTASDEANVVIARIAKNIYRVPRVVARLYDSNKADLYRRIGIQTISTTAWGIERATELLMYHQMDSVFEIGNGNVNIVRIEVPPLLVGHTVKEITAIGEIQVSGVSRSNKTFIPTTGTVFEAEDILHITVIASAVDKLKSMLGLA